MTEVIVKIMIEVLSILAIATKMIEQSRASELIQVVSTVSFDLQLCRKISEEADGKD